MSAIATRELLRHKILQHFINLPMGSFHDAIDIYDDPEVRAACRSVNDVSVKLSDMHKSSKHLLTRQPTMRVGSPVKYTYGLPEPTHPNVTINGVDVVDKGPIVKLKKTTKPSTAKTEVPQIIEEAPVSDARPHIKISANSIEINSPAYKLTIEFI